MSIDSGESAKAKSTSEPKKTVSGFAGLTLCQWSAILGLTFGWAGIIYGRSQSRLRKSVIEKLHPARRWQEIEQDPGRESSELTRRGDTRPEDL